MSFTLKFDLVFFIINQFLGLKPDEFTRRAIERFKIVAENHMLGRQTLLTIINDYHQASGEHPLLSAKLIDIIQQAACFSASETDYQQRFDNVLSRQMESHLAIELALHPTSAMLHSTSLISARLISLIRDERFFSTITESDFLEMFTREGDPNCFGAFESTPTLDEFIDVLAKPTTQHFIQTLFIHFIFAQNIFRQLTFEVKDPCQPLAKVASYISEWNHGEYAGDSLAFFNQVTPGKSSYIIDTKFYESDLYQAPGNRGRAAGFTNAKSTVMGLLRPFQHKLEPNLSYYNGTEWINDVLNQAPDHHSAYVTEPLSHEAIYVCGPSGIACMMLGQMEALAVLPSFDSKQQYLVGVMAFIVAGGFHSIHEVIGPAQYAQGLVPGYNVFVPGKGLQSRPPNYHLFYEQLSRTDNEFSAARRRAWQKTITFYQASIQPRCATALYYGKTMRDTLLAENETKLAAANRYSWFKRPPKREGDCIELVPVARGEFSPG